MTHIHFVSETFNLHYESYSSENLLENDCSTCTMQNFKIVDKIGLGVTYVA